MAAPAPITLAQAMADLQGKRLSQPVVVQDTQENLQQNLGWLQKLAATNKLVSVSLTGGGTGLEFKAAQLNTYSALVGKVNASGLTVSVVDTAANTARMASRIQEGYEVSITDTAANIQKNATALQAMAAANKIDTLSLTDSSVPVVMKASQFANTSALRALLSDATINVQDTAANVANFNIEGASQVTIKDTLVNVLKNATTLNTKASSLLNLDVSLSGRARAVTMTAAAYVASADLRDKLQDITYTIKGTASEIADNVNDFYGLKVAVTDTAANVQANLDVLQSFAESKQLALKVTDAKTGKMTMSVDQALQLGNLTGTSIQLEDSTDNIQANFDELLKVKKINEINLLDTARPLIEVSQAQYKKGVALLNKINGAAVSVEFAKSLKDYKITANNDGSYSVDKFNYKKVSFFKFSDTETFANTGDKNINAMVLGGTNYWWRDTANNLSTSDDLVKAGVYAMGSGSSKTTITYSFLNMLPADNVADSKGFKPMSDEQKAGVLRAFDYLSSLIGVTFEEVANASEADINFGTNNQYSQGSSAYANVPNGSGDHPVYLMLDNGPGNLNTSMATGSYGWQTLIHELGHTLGLKHPGNYNASGGSVPGPYLPKALDNRAYTLMSYNNPAGTMEVTKTTTNGISYKYSASSVNASTYMMYDIAALQFLYGKGTGAGLDAYQVNTFTADWSGMQTLWMPENGSIDASETDYSNIIDLRQGALSSINVIPKSITDSFPSSLQTAATYMGLNNVGLAFGSQVTTAKGGAATDVFYTTLDNSVDLYGGNGDDTVYLVGSEDNWRLDESVSTGDIQTYENLATRVDGAAGTGVRVTLNQVEFIKYYNPDNVATTHTRLDLLA
jgi:Metallo-peptidase family M12